MRLQLRHSDLIAIILLFAATAVVFWPASEWIARQTMANEQLRQSFFLLGFAACVLWLDHRHNLRVSFHLSSKGLAMLGGAFLLLATGFVWQTSLIPLAALAIALAAFVHFAFGDRGFNLTLPWLAGFGAFLFFMLLFHALDWPLRQLAASQSAQMLALLGYEVKIGAVIESGATLLLSVDGRFYEVATECNGFGLMSSSIILALLLVVSRPLGPGWKFLALALAFGIGFAFNIARIIGIVALAPRFPGHYDVLHETVGLTALFGGLLFLWWLLGGRLSRPEPGEKETPCSDPLESNG